MRFTIREIVCLTLALGMGLGWWANDRAHRNLHRQFEEDTRFAHRWRGCAETLADILEEEGWEIEWELDRVRFDATWRITSAKPQSEFWSVSTSIE
jgi:hypothetical protein